MKLQLNIVDAGGEPLPHGAKVRVELRDTSLEDVVAKTLKRVEKSVPKKGVTAALPVEVEIATVPDGTSIWVHLDLDGDGRVSAGDYVSTESYPVRGAPQQTMTIRLRKVR